MDKILGTLLKQTGKYNDQTIYNHLINMKRLTNFGQKVNRRYTKDLDYNILKQTKKIDEYIASEEIPLSVKKVLYNTAYNVAQTMFASDKKLVSHYAEKYKHFTGLADAHRVYARATDEQKENHVSMDDMVKMRNKLKQKITIHRQPETDYRYLLLCLYTYIPPLRTKEWLDCHLLDNEPDKNFKDNYINIQTGKMHIQKSKTEKKYGTRIIDIPNELIEILKENRKKTGSDLILHKVHDVETKNTENNIAHMFSNIFDKKIGVKLIRNIFISEKIDEGISAEERKKIAYIMGHSAAQQIIGYTKFSQTIHK